MEAKAKKIKNPEALTVRDFVTIAIIFVIYFVIFCLSAPIGMTVVGAFFTYPMCSLFWGTVYLLMCEKVNKNGAPLIFGLAVASIQLMNFWMSALIIAIGAVISEILWRKLDKSKISTIGACFTILVLSGHLGTLIPLYLLRDSFFEAIPNYAEFYTKIYEFSQGYMLYIGLVAAVIAPAIGIFIGKLILKKHFEKAGIVK